MAQHGLYLPLLSLIIISLLFPTQIHVLTKEGSVQSQESVSQLNSPGKMVCQSIDHPVFYGRFEHSQQCDDVEEGLFFFTSNNETATSRV
jgi:hypothetical protein